VRVTDEACDRIVTVVRRNPAQIGRMMALLLMIKPPTPQEGKPNKGADKAI
jgi:hypothetical protein